MKQIILWLLLAALPCCAQFSSDEWKKNSDGSISPKGGKTVVVGNTVLDPTARNNPLISSINLSTASAVNAPSALSTPVPYFGTEMVHPDVYFNPAGWNGHKFWMAATPYAGTDSAYENPSIYYSDDGQSWNTPVGLTNPVVVKPAGGYNSDTDI